MALGQKPQDDRPELLEVDGVAGGVAVQVALGRGLPVGRPAAGRRDGCPVLVAAKDLHGAAMVAGIVTAAVVSRQGTSACHEARFRADLSNPLRGMT
jgi:hypothetical protein